MLFLADIVLECFVEESGATGWRARLFAVFGLGGHGQPSRLLIRLGVTVSPKDGIARFAGSVQVVRRMLAIARV
ncbi:hypothetical protein ABLN97_09230 [Mycobacterium tuberculosis]